MVAYASGNDKAFAELYRRYEARIYGFLVRRLSPRQRNSTSDIFQKTWLKVHTGRKSFDSTKKFSAWIFTIAINALRDHLSLKEEKVSAASLEDVVEPASLTNQETDLMREQLKNNVHTIIEKLPTMQREAVLLCELEGFSSADAANIMNLSDGAVRQLLFRARGMLKTMLQGGL